MICPAFANVGIKAEQRMSAKEKTVVFIVLKMVEFQSVVLSTSTT